VTNRYILNGSVLSIYILSWLKGFSMKKKVQHQGRVDLTTVKNSEQILNRLFKKYIRAVSLKMLRRLFGTAALITLLSVKIGGGGGSR
jgi:hypothetical protein